MNAGALNQLECGGGRCSASFKPPMSICAPDCTSTAWTPSSRAHLERALAHIREASIAVNEQTKVRTVQELADQLTRIEQMQADLRAEQTPADESSTSIHV